MRKKLTTKEYLLVASMLFGLFFGAGNLIFPVSMGQQAGRNVLGAALGFCVTGVGLPLLGIAAMGISESKSLFDMSSRVGRGYAYFFTCALYLTIGPLFAIPRTATVSFQVGIAPMVEPDGQGLALAIFSCVFFALVLLFSLRPSEILTWVGRLLNPVFLLFMGVLIVVSLLTPMGSVEAAEATGAYASQSFFTGFLEGYNTMDALASLAFGIVLVEVIHSLNVVDPASTSLCTVKSGVFSTALMALIYLALAFIGAQSVARLGVSVDGGTALYLIAKHYFGQAGGLFLGILITFACLKTAIGLVTSCSKAFAEMFPRRVSYNVCAVVFSLFSLVVSNVGLNGIIAFSTPVLLFLYPLTIILILLSLFSRFFHHRRCIYVWTIALTLISAIPSALSALPAVVRAYLPFIDQLSSVFSHLPFSSIGMPWILPAAVGFILGEAQCASAHSR